MKTVKKWMSEWATAIGSQDFDAGRSLFAEEAAGFGTITFRTSSLDDLVERQWMPVWNRTKGFAFDDEGQHIHLSPDKLQASVQSTWRSIGEDPDVGDRERQGRATIVLVREDISAPWRCVHTHFSMWPDAADLAIIKQTT